MRIYVRDPDYYFREQHKMRTGYNNNDLYCGHQTKIDYRGFWDGKRHYGIFVYVYDPAIGSLYAVNLKYFNKEIYYGA